MFYFNVSIEVLAYTYFFEPFVEYIFVLFQGFIDNKLNFCFLFFINNLTIVLTVQKKLVALIKV